VTGEQAAHNAFIEALAKHLPPSAATLRLLDIDGTAGQVLTTLRGDLQFAEMPLDGIDAAVGFVHQVHQVGDERLKQILAALRPGGRLVLVDAAGIPDAASVERLESLGFVRILVEPAWEGRGVLLRGEKPHDTDDTLARVRQVADQDTPLTDFSSYRGRYVHLLVQQTPNKPVWRLAPGEQIEWRAVTLQRDDEPAALLAFSSLPTAVSFMQTAILNRQISGINKVVKFSRATAEAWPVPALLNPTTDDLIGGILSLIPVDPDSAEAPDE
jgi:SAM-dependent methyltransferase